MALISMKSSESIVADGHRLTIEVKGNRTQRSGGCTVVFLATGCHGKRKENYDDYTKEAKDIY